MITGCGNASKGNSSVIPEKSFGPFPPNPATIDVTRYLAGTGDTVKESKTFIFMGKQMNALYNSIKQKSKHVLPTHFNMNCADPKPAKQLWDYNIVVHYSNHKDRNFKQNSDSVKCTFLHDELSYAQSLGALPELSPLGKVK